MESAVALSRRLPAVPDRRPLEIAGCVGAVTVAAVAAAAITAAGPADHPLRVALARALIVAAPMAVGFYAWLRRRDGRFGLVLAAAGAGLLLTTLGESGNDLLYTVGRT